MTALLAKLYKLFDSIRSCLKKSACTIQDDSVDHDRPEPLAYTLATQHIATPGRPIRTLHLATSHRDSTAELTTSKLIGSSPSTWTRTP